MPEVLNPSSTRIRALGLIIVTVILLAVYLHHLQTIPNGSDHYYMIDVGESQIVLNRWGTLHATGYPLFVILGNVQTTIMRALGIDPLIAAALVGLWWGFVALGLVFVLARHVTGRFWLPLAITALFGLARTVWIHNVIAETYSFGLTLLVLLLLLGLWRRRIPGRIYWMALIGGIGVAHHRGIAMAIPALLYAVWPVFAANRRRLPRMVIISLLLGLLGFAQYAYLYFRARAGTGWVYGEPGTLQGLWDQFIGTEAARFIGPPGDLTALWHNLLDVSHVFIRDLSLPGVVFGLVGLLAAIRSEQHRRAAITIFLSGAAAYLFHVFVYTDVLSALTLPGTLALVFGWLFLGDNLLNWEPANHTSLQMRRLAVVVVAIALGVGMYTHNSPFVYELTHDPTGLQTISHARGAPSGSTLMLAWGPRHFAVGIERDVYGRLQDITLVDHKADYRTIIAEGALVTPEYTLYNHPLSWWQDRLDGSVYLRTAGPYLVEISTQPVIAPIPDGIDSPGGIALIDSTIHCTQDGLNLHVTWQAVEQLPRDLSVFVHALDTQGAIIADGDQFAPVYGWRPLTTWLPGEQITDIYPMAVDEPVESVQYGLYSTLPEGGFENVQTHELQVDCSD